ncbi:DUF441 domain-containing protein [Paenibacillus alginolyticus]|uniref:UPF0756 membrane protein M5X19_32490 n=1 Tax=Paenibacillus alginolyticus TaxID=59839 RepID=A0ABT4GN34_9BACL|nr:DUF441 domain-containing protein [Paenibacillus alginolyticus]MCY9667303.1 DUF441 domain-containing protein [Paenibacillus alginolyticus]MCY9697540.1 DUF441 domain-containing protein [Paenibacillus alginolyticus]MEC0142006.1 DUF441 domain-containing protein [Paenibacillus alginolyticus]
MPQLDMPSLMLILLALLGVISRNNSITIAAVVLLLIRVVKLDQAFPWIEKNGLSLGIIILTIGILSPLASGSISMKELYQSFLHWKSIAAIIVGVLVAYLGGRGAHLMAGNPTIVTSLVIGTIIGVAFLKGVPVGPLIAAGILSLLIGK